MPVIRRRDPCVQLPAAAIGGLAEEGEIGREIHRVEIALRVGQPVVGQANFIQRDDFRARRDQMSDVAHGFLCIESHHQQRRDICRGEVSDRLGGLTEHGFAECGDVLDKNMGNRHGVERIKLREGRRKTRGIIDRDRRHSGQPGHHRLRHGCYRRMPGSLEEREAALDVGKGVDVERHALRLPMP